jgi:hypothetical protein
VQHLVGVAGQRRHQGNNKLIADCAIKLIITKAASTKPGGKVSMHTEKSFVIAFQGTIADRHRNFAVLPHRRITAGLERSVRGGRSPSPRI